MSTPARTILDMPVSQLAEALSKAAGFNLTVETVMADVRLGAPISSDGTTMNLLFYTAWLCKQEKREKGG